MPSRSELPVHPVDAPVQRTARLVAVAFLVVALAGFVPGLTAHLERLEPAGWGSGALLFGILRVSVVANLMHVVMAGAGLLAAPGAEASRRYLLGGGTAYAVPPTPRRPTGGRRPGSRPGRR